MGSPTGLVLECRPSNGVTPTCASTSFTLANDLPPGMNRLEDFVSALEEERRKIDAFRRELPLCMQLLHDAIESYKEKLSVCKPSTQRWTHVQSSSSFNDTDSNLQSPNDRIVMEEFIPLRKTAGLPFSCNSKGELPHKLICKPDWMTATECLSFQAEANSQNQERCQTESIMERAGLQRIQEQAFSTSSKPFFHSKNKSGGAFMPFSRDKHVVQPTPRPGNLNPTDLVLTLKDQDASFLPLSETTGSLPNLGKVRPTEYVQQQPKELTVKVPVEGANGSNDSPPARKARRCWSPELHCRFVNALQQLGGSQVATPKQIRELMKVEGLTNDEVKSHLQKYRLHTRRPNPMQTASPQTPQVVVLGGIWVPPEYTVHAAAQQAPSLYDSSRQAPHFCQPASSQELCSELGSLDQTHLPPSPFRDQKLAPAHSQSSLQGPLQLTGHSGLAFHQSVDTGREESVGDDEGPDNSSCKGCPSGHQHHEVADMEDDRSQDDSTNGFHSHCTSEDGDSRGSDISLRMV
eukprot:c20772_g1_i1 orf=415-1974(+)